MPPGDLPSHCVDHVRRLDRLETEFNAMKEDIKFSERALDKLQSAIGELSNSMTKMATTQKIQTTVLGVLGAGALGIVWKALEKILVP